MIRMHDRLSSRIFEKRIAGVRRVLQGLGLECVVISTRENVRYLTGFSGSSGWVLVSRDDFTLITDARYFGRLAPEFPWVKACLATNALVDSVVAYCVEHRLSSLGFEGANLTYAKVKSLETALSTRSPACTLRLTEGLVERLRMVKDPVEVSAIQQASRLADLALAHALSVVHTGMTEHELSWQIERWLRENGSGPVPFGIIVASGPNAAVPHAAPGDRILREGEPIIIDLGATCEGYCSDLTRTIFLRSMRSEFGELYRVVLTAQQAALDGLRPGMSAFEADELARRSIRETSFGEQFTHGLGHGLGLEVHERPIVSSRSSDTLIEGMVFTVEPGVYVPGFGGVRIEDTVVLRNGKAQPVTCFPKGQPVVQQVQ